MRVSILLFFLFSILSACSQKKDVVGVKIFAIKVDDEIKINSWKIDSVYYGQYLIYDMQKQDTSYLKKITSSFIDSLIKYKDKCSFFQLEFYRKSRRLDTSYVETNNKPLFLYEKERIGTFMYDRGIGQYKYWNFYKEGKMINSPISDIKIEDIQPKNDKQP